MFAPHTAQTAYTAAGGAMATAFRNAAHAQRHRAATPAPAWATRLAALAQALHRALTRHE